MGGVIPARLAAHAEEMAAMEQKHCCERRDPNERRRFGEQVATELRHEDLPLLRDGGSEASQMDLARSRQMTTSSDARPVNCLGVGSHLGVPNWTPSDLGARTHAFVVKPQ